mmetsp:Transcript_26007/g.74023  ORF Transcript_26007/g.74023 Transcript_26007/m.74023 type:complete len:229 (-) Transcript_26007:371-1057(-)
MRLAKPCKNTAGSSGADGQVAVQPRGTSARISAFASATTSGVLSAVPWITFCSVPKECDTLSPNFAASAASISTNATTGASSGETWRTSTLRTLDRGPRETLSQSWNSGPKFCFQALMSMVTAPPPPPAPPTALASCLNTAIAFVELMRCRDRSAFGAMPKLCGLSMSGSCSTCARKSGMSVEFGMVKGGMSRPPDFILPGFKLSVLKKSAMYSFTNLESNSLSTRLP